MKYACDRDGVAFASEVRYVTAERQAPDTVAYIRAERSEKRKFGEAGELVVEYREIGDGTINSPMRCAIIEDGIEIAISIFADTDFNYSRVGYVRRG
nr:hypothetical protein [Polymorphobacter sp. PAMC 29334]